jgi:hypothetical protein
MRLAVLLGFGALLCGCEDQRAIGNDSGRSASIARSAPPENEAFCHDCDGIEVAIFNAQIKAMDEAYIRCGRRPVELVDNRRDGIRASDYRCRR